MKKKTQRISNEQEAKKTRAQQRKHHPFTKRGAAPGEDAGPSKPPQGSPQ